MTTTRSHDSTTAGPVLYLAFELARGEGKLGFTTSLAQPVRRRTVRGRNLEALYKEIAKAKPRLGLALLRGGPRRLLATPLYGGT
jgi:hypothetical protein